MNTSEEHIEQQILDLLSAGLITPSVDKEARADYEQIKAEGFIITAKIQPLPNGQWRSLVNIENPAEPLGVPPLETVGTEAQIRYHVQGLAQTFGITVEELPLSRPGQRVFTGLSFFKN